MLNAGMRVLMLLVDDHGDDERMRGLERLSPCTRLARLWLLIVFVKGDLHSFLALYPSIQAPQRWTVLLRFSGDQNKLDLAENEESPVRSATCRKRKDKNKTRKKEVDPGSLMSSF